MNSNQDQETSQPRLCASGCGFFGCAPRPLVREQLLSKLVVCASAAPHQDYIILAWLRCAAPCLCSHAGCHL